MKGVKGSFLRKLKFVPSINPLKQGLALQRSSFKCQSPPISRDEDHGRNNVLGLEVDSIEEFEHAKDIKDEETELGLNVCKEENFASSIDKIDKVPGKQNSEPAVSSEMIVEQKSKQEMENVTEESPFLTSFQLKCPPGGEDSVIFYTTSLRSIRKTFEDCKTVRFLLQSFNVTFDERDVSLHLEFRDELWRLLNGRVIPPRVFIKGRYIGGADEVVGLHEQGKLKKLLEGIPANPSNCLCNACGNIKFVVCNNCNGSCKVFKDADDDEDDDGFYIKCPDCNENGLVKCPICC